MQSILEYKGAYFNLKHLIFLIVFIAAIFLRFWNLAGAPYYEWDEPFYTSIGAHVAQTGVVQVKTEVTSKDPVYLYHPPFHFLLLGQWFNWFGASIATARVLAAFMSIVTLAVLFFFLVSYDHGRDSGALFALFLLALDGWMVFSNRVGWIENTMMPIGIMGLWIYDSALKDEKAQYWRYVTAGIVLGIATIYKHVGLYFLLTVPICWLLNGRKDEKAHLALALAAAGVIVIYVLSMYLIYGDHYVEHTKVQIYRTFGFHKARGIIENISQIWSAITGNYRIYAGMMVTTAIALGLFVRRAVQAFRARAFITLQNNTLLFSWTAAAILFFGSISLKIAHYYLMLLVPLYAFAALEVTGFLRTKPRMTKIVAGITALILFANVYTFLDMFAYRQKNAAAELRQYFDTQEPLSTVVIAEETDGILIRQPYLKLGAFRRHLDKGGFRKYNPSHLIIYRSITLQPPDDPDLERLIEVSTPIKTFEDFKSTLTVYRLPKIEWRRGGFSVSAQGDQ